MLFFQKREPVVHHLHDKQEELLNSFFSFFVSPEVLVKCSDLASLDLECEKHHLPSRLILQTLGDEICRILPKSDHKIFIETVKKAFVSCGSCLQKKMPLKNIALKICSVLDPVTPRYNSSTEPASQDSNSHQFGAS